MSKSTKQKGQVLKASILRVMGEAFGRREMDGPEGQAPEATEETSGAKQVLPLIEVEEAEWLPLKRQSSNQLTHAQIDLNAPPFHWPIRRSDRVNHGPN